MDGHGEHLYGRIPHVMAPISPQKEKDDTKVMERKKRAQRATVAHVEVGIIDSWGLLSGVKTEFMKAVGRLSGNEKKKELMLEFLDLAREIIEYRFPTKDI